jgi:predicted GNAT family acetyltransferase
MTTEVKRNDDRGRYELFVDGEMVGIAEFTVSANGEVATFPHTVIAPERRGTGLGDILVRGALDDVKGRVSKVVPACWFVADFIDANPEYADLVA